MRIISKFHDYYDGVMKHGQDEDLVWVRNTEEIKVDCSSYGANSSWFYDYGLMSKSLRHYDSSVEVFYLAFCGKLFSIHKAVVDTYRIDRNHVKPTFCASSYKEIREKFEKLTSEPLLKGDDYDPLDRVWWYKTSKEDLSAWLSKPCHALHTQFDCPVLLLQAESIIKCPVLKDLQFQGILDPFTTYQEIAQYISGVMAQKTCPTVVLSDKSKILKHGLDPKWSFRRRPEEK